MVIFLYLKQCRMPFIIHKRHLLWTLYEICTCCHQAVSCKPVPFFPADAAFLVDDQLSRMLMSCHQDLPTLYILETTAEWLIFRAETSDWNTALFLPGFRSHYITQERMIFWLLLTLDPDDQLIEVVLESSNGGRTYRMMVRLACDCTFHCELSTINFHYLG
jgi:hypothetical protein